MYFQILLEGLIVGLLASIPLGPIGVLVIRRTLGRGRMHGFVSGLGAATADTTMALIACLGVTMVIDFITFYKLWFQLFGGIIIIIVGIHTFDTNPVKLAREKKNMGTSKLHTDYLSVLALTITNPLVIFIFLAAFAGLNLPHDTVATQFVVVLGIFLGASLWWFILSSLVSFYRHKIRLRNLLWMNKISGSLIFIFGVAAIVSIFYTYLPFVKHP